ncbi:Ger(x)C family spore germination protein [Heliobacterium chlorum]|uniref:Ger(X)C family spore germination protein n=1 Tax=Heliobacterium chlorum TaxID=2698 RepID=A0ABR7T6J6_HELCL|nr:Ger(x)C family spore germination protein [Heliobacterium chlorum]MBC9785196.1 Ger(x)C family spore germination protein [Heliobacterium chlorum]
MIKFSAVVIILCAMICLTGCWDNREVETRAFVMTMGVDRSNDGNLDVIFRIAVPGNISQKGGQGAQDGIPEVTKPVTVTARSIAEAIGIASANVERRLDFRHLRLVVFGEKLAKEGLGPHLDVLVRTPQFRRTVYLWVAKEGQARDIFLDNVPLLEKSISRWVEGIERTVVDQGFSRIPTLHEFLIETESKNVSATLPIVGINQLVKSEKEGEKVVPVPTDKYHDKISPLTKEPPAKTTEDVPRSGGNPLEFLGIAILHSGKMVEKWSGWDARIFDLLRDRYRRGFWTFTDPSDPTKTFTVELNRSRPPHVSIEWNGDQPDIFIEVNLEGNIREIESYEPYVTTENIHLLEEEMEQKISQEIVNVVGKAQRKKVDPFYLARFVRTSIPTMQEYDNLDWEPRFSTARVSASANIMIRRPGLQIQTPTPNPM